MSNPTELLNCPFCGGDAQTDFIEGESYLIECYACRAETGIKDSEEDAISAWNRRAALASRPAYKVARMNPADAEMLESIKVEFQPLESTVARDYQAMMASRPAEVDDEGQSDSKRLMFAMQDIDGFVGIKQDKYDFAVVVMEERGLDEPDSECELEGVRRLIDMAMAVPSHTTNKEK